MADGTDDLIGYHYLEHAALGFALEARMWPLFVEWVKANSITEEGRKWAEAVPDITEIRIEWMLNSPDPRIRAIGEATRQW